VSDWIIRVENLGKRYRIQHELERQRYVALRDVLVDRCKRLFHPSPALRPALEDFWALKDVSFDIKQGEVVGIIGRNGAGKSTVLKILSRITQPTQGRVTLRGRVASLLEVGTGFHQELTGRENIFLNGAILGMTRSEIKRKFGEIVTFAEVERFLDTPVKRYSSGMYVRLAFAVAAHLEPEILVVDEVLAVGDADFQKKCLGKMTEVAQAGRTVLFVSHNENAVLRLCSRAILLRDGKVVFSGSPKDAFQLYRTDRQTTGFSTANRTHSSEFLKITDAALVVDGQTSESLLPSAQPNLELTVEVEKEVTASFEVLVREANSAPVLFGPVGLTSGFKYRFDPGVYRVSFQLRLPHLAEGRYSIDLMAVESGIQFFDYLEEAIILNLLPDNNAATGWEFRQARGQGCVLLETSRPQVRLLSNESVGHAYSSVTSTGTP
jgi:lipopolysaccharide transport system ATP-binding protein